MKEIDLFIVENLKGNLKDNLKGNLIGKNNDVKLLVN